MNVESVRPMSAPETRLHNPATGQPRPSVPFVDRTGAHDALERVHAAQQYWRMRPIAERAETIRRFAALLAGRIREVAELISTECGKPVQEAIELEILPITHLATYFADRAERLLRPERIPLKLLRHKFSEIEYRPRGVVYVVSPVNYPFSVSTGETIMALLAGNGVLHKPASLTPTIALRARELMLEAGLPGELYRVIPCAADVAFDLIGPGIDYLSFTGSTAAGRKISERCGQHLIPCSLQLGGNNPVIVLKDASLERTANAVVWGAFANSGQACSSVQRLFVPHPLRTELIDLVVDKARALRQGDPRSPSTDIGPMADEAQRRAVHQRVQEARQAGARVLLGGELPEGPGYFYPPTVLEEVTDDMALARDEIFGPVLSILYYDTVDEAIRRANASPYGLAASVFGRHDAQLREVAARLQVGTVMLNEVVTAHVLAETPWSGTKASGVGRVHSDEGLRDLCYRVHVHGNRVREPSREYNWFPYSPVATSRLEAASRIIAEHGVAQRLGRFAREMLRGNQPS